MSNTKKKSTWFKRIIKIILISLLLLIAVANLYLLFSGRTYIYKGIQETYLKGRSGPGIYDSITFPIRQAEHNPSPKEWKVQQSQIQLDDSITNELKKIETTSFLIIQNGTIIHESYYRNHTASTRSNSFSAAKSFIGLLIGIAIDEGKIAGFDAPIHNYLPFRLPNDSLVTIRQLMGMSSGLDWSESGGNPLSDNAAAYYGSDLTELLSHEKFVGKPGQSFDYASGNSQLLGIILKEATGKYPTDYLEEKVWSKMNTKHDLSWSLDHEDGLEKAFCCIYATTRDYARFGQLLLNKGKANGQQLIKESTLRTLLRPFNSKSPHYGLQFWRYESPDYTAYYARGILGQYIIAIPELDVVMVRTGHQRKEKYFIPKSKSAVPTCLPAGTAGRQEDSDFVRKNRYKEYHPLDLFTYFSALKQVLNKEK